MKIQGYILYKIYYDESIIYIGRTNQPLQNRIRGHLFKKPMHRSIDINLVTKIEYATFKTEADRNLYEIYFINKEKPPFNVDDKTSDDLTITLPEVDFKMFECHLWDNWKREINSLNDELNLKRNRYRDIREECSILRGECKTGKISTDDMLKRLSILKAEENILRDYLYG
jgi:hypothetical protein